MDIKIILYAKTFIILINRVDTSVRKLRFVSFRKLIEYILDNVSIRNSYISNSVEIINKIPYRNTAIQHESLVTAALQT